MKTLNLNEYGVNELTDSEILDINGGGAGLTALLLFLGGVVVDRYIVGPAMDDIEYLVSKVDFSGFMDSSPRECPPLHNVNIWNNVSL